MATLTVRLPAAATHRAARAAAWSRHGELSTRALDLPRRATPVLNDVYTLQPPGGEAPISVAPGSTEAGAVVTASSSAGWFESTWELQQGLDMAEGLPGDMPLEAWLQVYLRA